MTGSSERSCRLDRAGSDVGDGKDFEARRTNVVEASEGVRAMNEGCEGLW